MALSSSGERFRESSDYQERRCGISSMTKPQRKYETHLNKEGNADLAKVWLEVVQRIRRGEHEKRRC
jgi:hypothetical protein